MFTADAGPSELYLEDFNETRGRLFQLECCVEIIVLLNHYFVLYFVKLLYRFY